MAIFYNPTIIRDNLVLCLDAANRKSYPGSGTVWTDLSGRGNNGELVNGVSYVGTNGGALSFDGSNDRITIANPILSSTGNWTISSWCNFSSFNIDLGTSSVAHLYTQYIADTGNGRIVFRIVNDGSIINKLSLFLGSGATYSSQVITGTTTINTNTFYNFVSTRNGNIFTTYINGVLEASSTLTGINITILQSTPEIGGTISANFGFLTGKIYATSIYNRALSASEIKQNYNATKSRYGL